MRGEGTVRDLTATGPLILVNTAHPLRTPTNPELVALEGGVLLERRAAAASFYENLLSEVRAAQDGGEQRVQPHLSN